MGLVVLEGTIILVLVLTGFRLAVFHAVPAQLKTAISVGIGLFITIIGFVDAGFVRKSFGGPALELGIGGFLAGWPTVVFVAGLAIIVTLYVRGVHGAILIGIVAATVLAIVIEAIAQIGPRVYDDKGTLTNPTAWGLGVPALPGRIIEAPDFGLLGHFSLLGSFTKIGAVSAVLLVFTLLLADFFDTMGTTPLPPSPVGREPSPRTPPTSNRPPGWARGPAPAWPPSSPACCFCWRRCSPRWSQWCPMRRPRRRWFWSAS
jgi:AGZA family xanthine/uracil permease-like MFS transporter